MADQKAGRLNPEQVGKWLKAVREAAGLTQEEASQRSGVKLGVIAKSEQGRDLHATNFLALVNTYKAAARVAELSPAYITFRTGPAALPRDAATTKQTRGVSQGRGIPVPRPTKRKAGGQHE